MQRKALEIDLYAAGAGAFAVFLRWLQNQLAFNELGLADRSIFHPLLLIFLAAAAAVFLRFIRELERKRYFMAEDFSAALRNEGRLYLLLRWLAGGAMALGGLALFAVSGTDKYEILARILAVTAVLAGLAYPLLLGLANREENRSWLLCLLSFLPILLFAVWLIYSYRVNSINSVIWGYALDVFTPIAAMAAFYRAAGLPFGAPKSRALLFSLMFGTVMCMMAMADERYLGLQLILLGAAGQLLLYNWILICNLKQGKAREVQVQSDGFEHL